MELGKVLAPLNDFREKMLFVRGLYNVEATKGQYSQLTNGQSPLRRAAGLRRRDSFRHEHRSVSRPALRRFHESAQPGARLREIESLGAQELFDALQLAYFVELSHDADAARNLPGARLRSASLRRARTAAKRACSTRCWPMPTISAARSVPRTNTSSTNTSTQCATSNSASKMPGKKGELQGWRPTLEKPNIPRPPDGIPQDIGDHMRLMADILVLGFQTDTTRITTLKLNNDHSSLRFPNLGVDYMIHHLLSHSDTDDWLKVNRFFLEQVAYIARKLDSIQEGPRTLLDNSMLLFCSEHALRQPRQRPAPGGRARRRRRSHPGRAHPRLSPANPTARCAAFTYR